MGRDPRIVPPGSLQHVVDVAFQNRHLFRPSRALNHILVGVLGRAQQRYDMEIVAFVALSTHVHLLLRPRDAQHLADFMGFLKTNLSKEIGRLQGWRGSLFDGRYHTSTVSEEEAAQVGVLRYVLSQSVKEGLVARVEDWPGVHCGPSLVRGESLKGAWHDRTAEHAGAEKTVSKEEVVFSRLPCWASVPDATWRRWVAEMIEDIETKAAKERGGRPVLGAKKVCSADPEARPAWVSSLPQRRFHAVSEGSREVLKDAWHQLIEAYRRASKELRYGDAERVVREKWFPEGMFAPSLGFVGWGEAHAWSNGAVHLPKIDFLRTCLSTGGGRGRPD